MVRRSTVDDSPEPRELAKRSEWDGDIIAKFPLQDLIDYWGSQPEEWGAHPEYETEWTVKTRVVYQMADDDYVSFDVHIPGEVEDWTIDTGRFEVKDIPPQHRPNNSENTEFHRTKHIPDSTIQHVLDDIRSEFTPSRVRSLLAEIQHELQSGWMMGTRDSVEDGLIEIGFENQDVIVFTTKTGVRWNDFRKSLDCNDQEMHAVQQIHQTLAESIAPEGSLSNTTPIVARIAGPIAENPPDSGTTDSRPTQ